MKQENKFVAQLFHYLAPFTDTEKDLYICIDGGAAKNHSGNHDSVLLDPGVPDIWLTLVGQSSATGIEAKVLEDNKISFRQNQILAWRSNGVGNYKPKFWVATNRVLDRYYCWRHLSIVTRLDTTDSTADNVSLSVSNYPADFESSSLAELALFIIAEHRI